jgi:hypothetical protein
VIFAFGEDGTLEVFGTAAEATLQYEGIDVESGVVRFYDEHGTFLEPRFTTPNRRGRILGLMEWVESGTYELVPNPTADEDSFALALYETQVLEPNQWFSSVEELKTSLAAKGVPVRFEPKTRPAND